MTMTKADLIIVRAQEEITEHGSKLAALEAVRRQIASADSIAPERAFMRKVAQYLLDHLTD